MSALTPEPFGAWTVPTRRRGAGRPVLYVHGSADSPLLWRGVMDELDGVESIALDVPNAVEDDDPPPTLLGSCLERDYEILSSVVDAFERPALVAHSYGALLALRFARRRPKALSALMLIEPIAFGLIRDAGGVYDAVQQACAAFLQSFGDRARDEGLRALIDYWNGPGTWDAFPDRIRGRLSANALRTRAEVLTGDQDRTTEADLGRIPTPAAVVLGQSTTVASRAICWQLASGLPDATLHRVDGAGHSPARSHPAVVAEHVRALLARAPA
jgi:pimeloyl-ACP methyl ester carboxylesterase